MKLFVWYIDVAGEPNWPTDIKSAFWLLSVNSNDYKLLSFLHLVFILYGQGSFNGLLGFLLCIWKFFTFGECVLCKCTGLDSTSHFLDYFLCRESRNWGMCLSVSKFHCLAEELGVPQAHEKTEGPFTCSSFLGVEIDTVTKSPSSL